MTAVCWLIQDFVRFNTLDSDEPRLVLAVDTPQFAHRICAVLNARPHPAAAMGYRYDYRVSAPVEIRNEDAGQWSDSDILRIVDPEEVVA